jgi:hypothetical protein
MFLQHILHCPINVFGHLALVIVYSWIMKIGKSESEYQTTPKIHSQTIPKFIHKFLSTDFYINRKAIFVNCEQAYSVATGKK